jgi:hypothetical protein
MNDLDRRDFIKSITLGGAVVAFESVYLHKPHKALASGKYDIGKCKSVRIKCISESSS